MHDLDYQWLGNAAEAIVILNKAMNEFDLSDIKTFKEFYDYVSGNALLGLKWYYIFILIAIILNYVHLSRGIDWIIESICDNLVGGLLVWLGCMNVRDSHFFVCIPNYKMFEYNLITKCKKTF